MEGRRDGRQWVGREKEMEEESEMRKEGVGCGGRGERYGETERETTTIGRGRREGKKTDPSSGVEEGYEACLVGKLWL